MLRCRAAAPAPLCPGLPAVGQGWGQAGSVHTHPRCCGGCGGCWGSPGVLGRFHSLRPPASPCWSRPRCPEPSLRAQFGSVQGTWACRGVAQSGELLLDTDPRAWHMPPHRLDPPWAAPLGPCRVPPAPNAAPLPRAAPGQECGRGRASAAGCRSCLAASSHPLPGLSLAAPPPASPPSPLPPPRPLPALAAAEIFWGSGETLPTAAGRGSPGPRHRLSGHGHVPGRAAVLGAGSRFLSWGRARGGDQGRGPQSAAGGGEEQAAAGVLVPAPCPCPLGAVGATQP